MAEERSREIFGNQTMNQKIHKRIKKIKDELNNLYSEFREDTLILQAQLEQGIIPDNLSKAQFRKIVSEQINILNRDVIDRLFLEKLEILETPKRTNQNKKKHQTTIGSIGKLASKIRGKQMSKTEKEMILDILKGLNDDINKQ